MKKIYLLPFAFCVGLINSYAQTNDYVPKWNGSAYVNTVTPIFEDNTNSRIGIGTTSPGAKFEVAGTGSFLDPSGLKNTLQIGNNGTVSFITATAYSGGSYTPIAFSSGSGGERMRITTSGNVGIGTTSPSGLLANTSTAFAGGGASDGLNWRSLQNDYTAVIIGAPSSGAGYGLRLHTNGATSSDFPFAVSSGTGSGTLNFIIRGDGRVGIGTTSPNEILEVAGNVRIGSTNSYMIAGDPVLWHKGTTTNIFVGVGAGAAVTTGTKNTFIGNAAGKNTIIGDRNTAVGDSALYTSEAVIANGNQNDNTAVGFKAMFKSDWAYGNTAIGSQALYNNVNGMENVAIGLKALYNCAGSTGSPYTGWENTAVGYYALYSNVSGRGNVGMGDDALYSTTGDYNIGIGPEVLEYNQSGSSNTAMGYHAGLGVASNSHSHNSFYGFVSGFKITTGNQNSFYGDSSGYNNTSVSKNTFLGESSGFNNTTGGSGGDPAGPNVFVGGEAGYKNVTGSGNTFTGYRSGYFNTVSSNTFYGCRSGYSNTTGTPNTCIGFEAGQSNQTGFANTHCGYQAGKGTGTNSNTGNSTFGYQAGTALGSSGDSNTLIGDLAGSGVTTGDNNVAVGASSLGSTTGGDNTAVGYNAGSTITTGSSNTCIGISADVNSSSASNRSAIGNGAVSTADNTMMLGNTSSAIYCNNMVWGTSDGRFKINVQENVKGLDFINRLRPVTYQMDTKALDDFVIQDMPDSIKSRHQAGMDFASATSKIRAGFIAQEVEQAGKDAGFVSDIVHTPTSNSDPYALAYAEIVVPLVKAVQELSKTVDSLKAATNGSGQHTINNENGNDSDTEMQNDGTTEKKAVQDIKLALPDGAKLGEPQPNPNSGNTQIAYYLPQNTADAKIIFTDMLGKVMEERVLEPGYGLLNIDTQDLPGGVYSYSLVVNGKVIDNKKMMRNK